MPITGQLLALSNEVLKNNLCAIDASALVGLRSGKILYRALC